MNNAPSPTKPNDKPAALLLAENWPPRVGGIEQYLTHLAAALPDKTVTVVAPRARAAIDHPTQGVAAVLRQRFFWPLVRPAWLPLYVQLHRLIKQKGIKMFLAGKALFEGLVGFYLKKYLGIPYILFTYAMEIEEWQKTPRARRKLERVISAADRIVTINDHTAKTLRTLGATDQQLVTILPGVDERYFKEKESIDHNTLEQHGIKQPYILCVSRLVERKGINLLIEAFAALDLTKFSDYSLVIAGDGPQRSSLEEQASNLYIEKSVHFLGPVPDGELPSLYRGATLFALTPRFAAEMVEGFGIVYAEAAACGIPTLGTRGGGSDRAVIHEETGLLVKPNEIPAITAALERLLGDDALRLRLGTNARTYAQERFRWADKGKQLEAVISDLQK